MIRVVDADCTADLVNTQGRGFEQVAGDTDSPPVQVLERCDTIVFAELPADAVFTDAESGFQIIERVIFLVVLLKQIVDLFYIRRNFAELLIFL